MRLRSSLARLCVSPLPAPASRFALPLRLIVGFGFIAILHAIGMPSAHVLGWATIVVEVSGGSLIRLGAWVPVAAVPMIVALPGAIFTVHLPHGSGSIKRLPYRAARAHLGQPGCETDLLCRAGLLALCFGGAGPASLDGYSGSRRTD